MITLENLKITEHEAVDFIYRENFSSEQEYWYEKSWAKDLKLLCCETLVGEGNKKKLLRGEYRIHKEVLVDHPEEARKAALENLLAHLASALLENNGGII